jgi:hypothetical protein
MLNAQDHKTTGPRTKGPKDRAPIVALVALGLLGLGIRAFTGTASEGPTLQIGITNVAQCDCVDWFQVLADAPDGTGSYQIPVVTYTGPGYVISALTETTCYLEYSSSIETPNWRPFPSKALQVTFLPGSNSLFIPCRLGPAFFRTKS